MGVASYLRFFIGLALSIEVIREVILKESVSTLAVALSLLFIALSLLFFFKINL